MAIRVFSRLLAAALGLACAAASAQVTFRAATQDGLAATPVAAITFVAAGTATNVTSGNPAVALPAGIAAGDLLLCGVQSRDNIAHTITTPAGWTRESTGTSGASHSASVFWKRAAASETAPTVTWGGSTRLRARCFAFRNVIDSGSPFDSAVTFNVNATASTTTTSAAITTVTANAMDVFFALAAARGGSTSTPSGGFTSSGYSTSAGGDANPNSIAAFHRLVATAGAQAAVSTTRSGGVNTSGVSHGFRVALRPQAGTLRLLLPAGTVANDVMVAAVTTRSDSGTVTVTPPAGWTLQNRTDNATSPPNSLLVYTRVAGGSEPAFYDFAIGTSTGVAGSLMSFAGVDTTNPLIALNPGALPVLAQNTAASYTHCAPASTTDPGSGAMVVTHHAFSSAVAWITNPTGMTERVDVASQPPQSDLGIALGGYTQAWTSGTIDAKCATGSDAPTTDTGAGNAHVLALRPVVTTPGSFNAFETSTAGGAVVGNIQTRVAGTAYSLDVVAILSGAQMLSFNGNVTIDVLGNTATAVPLDGNNCPTSFTVLQTIASQAITGGRSTVSFAAQANVWRNVRIRIRFPTVSPTVTSCSTNNFAIRPSGFTLSASDTNWDTPGTGRLLNNTTLASGGVAHKAGRQFTLTATVAPASATQYDGNLALVSAACRTDFGLAACATGTLATGAWSGLGNRVAGGATYSEVGSLNLLLQDDDFASVDAADTPALQRIVPQTGGAIAIGRFVPDRFEFVSPNTPQLRTFGATCVATRSFTYVGQPFGWVTSPANLAPTATVRAVNAAGGITTNYRGPLFKLTAASIGQSFSNNGVGPAVDATAIGTPSLAEIANTGTGTYTAAAGGTLRYTRSTAAPVAPYTANLSLSVTATDATDAAAAGPGAASTSILTPTPLVFNGGGPGIAFDSGALFRYGILRMDNAYGVGSSSLPVPLAARFWNGSAFVVNTADNCTTLSTASFSFSNYSPSVFSSTVLLANAGRLTNGAAGLSLTAPGATVRSAADLTLNLTAENKTFLQLARTVATYTQDPLARVGFGLAAQPGNFIFFRENF